MPAMRIYYATCAALLGAGGVAMLVAWLAGALPGCTPAVPGVLPLLRLGTGSLLVLAAIGASHALASHAERCFTTSWWDPAPSAYDADLEWKEVHALVACGIATDPLAIKRRPRWRGWGRRLALYLLGAFAIWGVLLSGLDLLLDPRPRSFMLVEPARSVVPGLGSVLANPTAYLALLAAIVTIAFTYFQLRAKVRADSRQQWIIRARELLGQVVALTDAYRDTREARRFPEMEEIWNRMNPLRLELELMLNPSEKDHRLLLYLIQRFASRGRSGGEPIQDARMMYESIKTSEKPDGSEMRKYNGSEGPDLGTCWNAIIYVEKREDLVSYILRLSHVVLKREWERVKHTR